MEYSWDNLDFINQRNFHIEYISYLLFSYYLNRATHVTVIVIIIIISHISNYLSLLFIHSHLYYFFVNLLIQLDSYLNFSVHLDQEYTHHHQMQMYKLHCYYYCYSFLHFLIHLSYPLSLCLQPTLRYYYLLYPSFSKNN